MLNTKDICSSYGKHNVLQNISLELQAGEILGLLGPNGSGKSTLMNLLALIRKPDCGQIYFEKTNVWEKPAVIRRLVGYVPQDIALFEELTVHDNLMCWSRQKTKTAKKRIAEISEQLDLESISGKRVSTLSGGMKRRVNLAVALLDMPKLLIMDEPFAGIDSEHEQSIENFLIELRKQGISQIISGHNPEQIIELADKLLILNQGMTVFNGSSVDFRKISAVNSTRQTMQNMLTGRLV